MNYFDREVGADGGPVFMSVNTDYLPTIRITVGPGIVYVKDWREAKRFANAIIHACEDAALLETEKAP